MMVLYTYHVDVENVRPNRMNPFTHSHYSPWGFASSGNCPRLVNVVEARVCWITGSPQYP